MAKKWIVSRPSSEQVRALACDIQVSELLGRILVGRNLTSASSARRFLTPRLTDLYNPEQLPDVDKAANRIFSAVRDREKIMIYGDYDVDGITSSVILKRCIELAGGAAEIYLPHRIEEGYGVRIGPLKNFVKEKVSLLISVDCGISACEEAHFARTHNIDFIITDHHEPGAERPKAYAVINPKMDTSRYPFKNLAGAGVAFKLAWMVAKKFSPGKMVSEPFKDFLMDSLALVCLGTISDVVPLVDENRILAKFGLPLITHSSLPGLQALIETADLSDETITSYDVAYKLGPRLNAAGRMADAKLSIQLLSEADYGRALKIARELEGHNRQRQKMQNRISEEVRQRLKKQFHPGRDKAIVLEGPWHEGVLGIVAGRIAEEFLRPTVIISVGRELAKASGRSIPGINLYEALKKCEGLLEGFGGHARAAGLTIPPANISKFRRLLNRVVSETSSEEDFLPLIQIDAEVGLSELTPAVIDELNLERKTPVRFLPHMGCTLQEPPAEWGSRQGT